VSRAGAHGPTVPPKRWRSHRRKRDNACSRISANADARVPPKSPRREVPGVACIATEPRNGRTQGLLVRENRLRMNARQSTTGRIVKTRNKRDEENERRNKVSEESVQQSTPQHHAGRCCKTRNKTASKRQYKSPARGLVDEVIHTHARFKEGERPKPKRGPPKGVTKHRPAPRTEAASKTPKGSQDSSTAIVVYGVHAGPIPRHGHKHERRHLKTPPKPTAIAQQPSTATAPRPSPTIAPAKAQQCIKAVVIVRHKDGSIVNHIITRAHRRSKSLTVHRGDTVASLHAIASHRVQRGGSRWSDRKP